MSDEKSNDNEATEMPAALSSGNPHGEAALLLVEGLIHALIDRSLISTAGAIEIVDGTIEVRNEIAADRGDAPSIVQQTTALLDAIRRSLAIDLGPTDGGGSRI